MRFVINFIVFGFLFYVLWRFAPDLFQTLVSWVDAAFESLKELVMWGMEKFRGAPETPPAG